jgi:NitT/TauT family transport system permease protein
MVAEVIDVGLPRPRTAKMQFLPEFGRCVERIGDLIARKAGGGGAVPRLRMSRAARRAFLENYGLPVITLVGTLVVWEVGVDLLKVPLWLVPAPSDILAALAERGGGIWIHIWVTFYETLLGFLLSIVLGVPLAVVIVHSRLVGNAVYPLILITQSIPKVAFAPILLIWLGYGDFPKVLVAFLVAFFPVVVDTATGLRSPAPQLLDLARQLSASQFQIYKKIRFPSALPHFFSGLKVAITLAVIGAVIGEFVGSERGLGFLVIQATSHFKTPMAFAAMCLLAVMAIVLFFAVVALERVLCPWYGRNE